MPEKVRGEEVDELLDLLIDYDNGFIDSCNRFYNEHGYLTRKQFDALVSILEDSEDGDELFWDNGFFYKD